MKQIFTGLVAAMLLAGCASNGKHAPVVERGTAMTKPAAKVVVRSGDKDWRPRVHTVQKGDTLYGIAFNYGLDYRDLAQINALSDVNHIEVGQQLSLFNAVVRQPAVVDSRPLQAAPPVATVSLLKDQPKVVKYAYSETAVAKAEAVQSHSNVSGVARVDAAPKGEAPKTDTVPKGDTKSDVRAQAKSDSRSEARQEEKAETVADSGEEAMEWSMPTQGKLVASFSEADNRKGIDIAGKMGQPIFASAPGKVVYSGSGLRGYGKLLIIKHNKTFLSAYAHNDQLLVKEGETVTRGQKIAEMGNTDTDQVQLHFEVRRLGKPVDPANYLALNKS
ncbi:MAG: peptidoglycan DD-metalloendopeptidase family protein [Gallionella sp.]|jgi:lipoprotein NlpD